MKKKQLAISVVGVAAIAIAMAPSARARGVGAGGADAATYDPSCFNEGAGYIYNNRCSQTFVSWNLPVDTAGNKTVTVGVMAPSSANTVSCYTYGVNQFATSGTSNGLVAATTYGTGLTITLTGANVPGNGYLYLACYVGLNGQVSSIVWNQ